MCRSQFTHAQWVKSSPIRRTPNTQPLEPTWVLFLYSAHRCQRRCVASAPGPLGSVPRASNSQQAMWENSHQQVRVKSAAGSRPRCLRLCPLSPSLSGSLLIDSQSMSTFFRRRCDLLHCHRDPPSLLKCADELTRSRQIRTCYLKSGDLGALINLRGPSMALCCCIMRWKKCSYKPERGAAALCMNTCLAGWLLGVDSKPRSPCKPNKLGFFPLKCRWISEIITL